MIRWKLRVFSFSRNTSISHFSTSRGKKNPRHIPINFSRFRLKSVQTRILPTTRCRFTNQEKYLYNVKNIDNLFRDFFFSYADDKLRIFFSCCVGRYLTYVKTQVYSSRFIFSSQTKLIWSWLDVERKECGWFSLAVWKYRCTWNLLRLRLFWRFVSRFSCES